MLQSRVLELTSQVLTHVLQQNIPHSHSSKASLPSRAINTASRSTVLEPNPPNPQGRNNEAIAELRQEQCAGVAKISDPESLTLSESLDSVAGLLEGSRTEGVLLFGQSLQDDRNSIATEGKEEKGQDYEKGSGTIYICPRCPHGDSLVCPLETEAESYLVKLEGSVHVFYQERWDESLPETEAIGVYIHLRQMCERMMLFQVSPAGLS